MTRRVLFACALMATLAFGVAAPTGAATATRPSKTARMICQAEARGDLAGVLAITPIDITEPTWRDGTYSCTYHYQTGSFTISVTELKTRAATRAYFNARGVALQRLDDPVHLGDDAFQTSDGTTVVRKDNKVLEVDASQLPQKFSKLALDPASVASTVTTTILGCWTG
jgi:hypothetical protein